MDKYGILGQINVTTGGAWETLYSCPVPAATTYSSGTIEVAPQAVARLTQAAVSSIIVCNTTGSADTYSIRLLPESGTTPDSSHLLFNGVAIAASTTIVLSLGMLLGPGNTIQVTCATTGRISFTALGSEVT